MNKYFTKEVRIALAVLAGIVVLFVGMNFLKGVMLFSDDYSYKVQIADANGLTQSNPVYANGLQVGVVRDVTVDFSNMAKGITVTIDVDKRMRIPEGTIAEVDADLMGNLKMNLVLASSSKSIEPGGTIMGRAADGVMNKVADLVPYLETIVPKLDSIMTSVNTLLADPAVVAILRNTETTTANLSTSTAELNRMLAQMNRQVPGLLQKADKTMANTEQLTGNLAKLDVASTMASVDATLKNCEELTNKLNSNSGTIGKLLNDSSLYDNLNATIRDADSLMIDLKAHPKRYVHFSVFGKKDK
ncbi:MCE family protein [Prevotella sp. PINT]|jgi:ABC-type transport system involved in resistance to organic solvents, periplasmic component|uniref:MlaD family protein n=1 Tax=Palleniella intestinalis TaxID=2736291 RepID=UPI001557A503|nr:MlaD family protein [Palleniella intestinalis]NPD81077.1 MCE family protein [Palleniella intestinalis]